MKKSKSIGYRKLFFIYFYDEHEDGDMLCHERLEIGSLNALSFLGATNCNKTT